MTEVKREVWQILGENIRFEQQSRQLTVQQLADAAEVPIQEMERLEHGGRAKDFCVHHLLSLADYLGKQPAELLRKQE